MDIKKLKRYAEKVKSENEGFDKPLVARVAGVTFEGRQELLKKMTPDTAVGLERDRRNEHDFYAVKVMAYLDDSWQHVGFIPRPMNKKICKSLDQSKGIRLSVHRISGGFEGHDGRFLNYGLDVYLEPL